MVKKRPKREGWKILLVICIIIVSVLIVILLTNAITREKYELTPEQRSALIQIYPTEHIAGVNFYRGGLFSFGSSRTVCNSVYIPDHPAMHPEFFDEPNSEYSIELLVHEVMHTFQARKGCFSMSVSSLYIQLRGYVRTGIRDSGYHYYLNENFEDYNVEQEASIIEDYYLLFFTNLTNFYLYCEDCGQVLDDETLIEIENKSRNILKQYE